MKTRRSTLLALLAIFVILTSINLSQPVIADDSSSAPPASSSPGDGSPKSAASLSAEFRAAADRVGPSVVRIISSKIGPDPALSWDEVIPKSIPDILDAHIGSQFANYLRNLDTTPTHRGSGVIVSPNGYIVTSSDVVDGLDKIAVQTQDKKEYPATVVKTDPCAHLAVLKIKASGFPASSLASSDVQIGDWVLAIGRLSDDERSVSAGIVSSWSRHGRGAHAVTEMRTDATVDSNNRGGPLVNLAGEVVAIASAGVQTGNDNGSFSVAAPVGNVRRLMNEVISAESAIEHARDQLLRLLPRRDKDSAVGKTVPNQRALPSANLLCIPSEMASWFDLSQWRLHLPMRDPQQPGASRASSPSDRSTVNPQTSSTADGQQLR